jgi:hypothetical protein
MLQFKRYIGIDYSGAETPESSCKGLRVYISEGTSFHRPPFKYTATASRCASNPRPLLPCCCVDTLR